MSVNDGPSHVYSALLVPSQPKAAIIPLFPILLTSQDVQVTIHPSARSVYITSPSRGGLLSLQSPTPDVLISSIASALPSVISIPDPDNQHVILLANPDRAPARLFVIPLSVHSSASAPSTLSLPLSPILPHLQFLSNAPSSYFSISKPTRFISTSAAQVQLSILDFGGAHFSLSPVYDLLKPDGDVRLSLLAKHNRITTPTSHSLLTPPPSPPMSNTETQPLHFPEENRELSDQIPIVHIQHVDDRFPQPIEPALTSGQSSPSQDVQAQLASGQSTPKPRPVDRHPEGATPKFTRSVQRGMTRKLIYFVLRILAFYARVISKIVLVIFARLFCYVLRGGPAAAPKVTTIQLGDGQTEIKSTSVSSAAHTPTLLTPRRQHSGASTPRNGAVNSRGQKVLGIAETLEAVATKIVPEFSAKTGEEEKPQEDLGGSYVQEPALGSAIENEKSGHNGEWEVVHRPGIVFEIAALLSPSTVIEGEAPPKIKPIRVTLDGPESVVEEIKFHLDDLELTNVKVQPLTGPGQEGLWTAEIPRASRDLTTLRIS